MEMEHGHLAIVLILTVGFALASVFAYLARRCGMPTILGYMLAGFIIGPYSPGFVADMKIAEQLAEIGVILMLFGVGLHFKLQDLIDVKDIAIPGATVQTLAAAVLTTLFLYYFGWPLESGLIMGLSVGVASTVVLVRVLTDNHLLNTKEGHIAIGWLVVEDIFTVVILILLPSLAAFIGGGEFSFLSIAGMIGLVLLKFVVLALFMFTWGHKIVNYCLTNVARLRSQEMFTLTVIALMFVIAAGSTYLFGTSIALGAFIAGMVIGKTSVRHQAAANALPLKDIFAVIFFLSVGMLFNPMAIYNHLWVFLCVLSIILIVKPVSAFLISRILKYPSKVALTIAVSLSQIGEFSFILGEEAMNLKLLPEEGFDILVASALVSISINPLLFQFTEWAEKQMDKRKFSKRSRATLDKMSRLKVPFFSKVLIVGFGPIGRKIAEMTKELGFTPIIIEHNIDTVSDLEEEYEIFYGDATESMILKDAHIEEASYLFITLPDTQKTLGIIDAAKHVHPGISIAARIRYVGDIPLMKDLKVHYVCTESEALKEFTRIVPKLLRTAKPLLETIEDAGEITLT